MSASPLPPAIRSFVDYFGTLGPRWGLNANACRVHAYLYLMARPVLEKEIGPVLGLDAKALVDALSYLEGYRMVERIAPSSWRTGGDPWDMLMSGLEERRRREIGPALATLRDCHRQALDDHAIDQGASQRIEKLLDLVEDLAAIDNQARRLSPQLLRGIVGLSGRAARLVDRAFGTKKDDR